MKKMMILLLVTLLVASGCSALSAEAVSESTSDSAAWFSDRDTDWAYDPDTAIHIRLTGDGAECAAKEVEIDGNTVNIIDEGVFVISGTLKDGMIRVLSEKKDKVQIVLDNADIHSIDCAPIYVRQADKVFITLAENSENSLSNGGSFEAVDDSNIDGVIFSKEDLSLNGIGSLKIISPDGHGIVGKDDLVIAGGSYSIESAGHGISGKDSIAVADGTFAIRSGKDGFHSDNGEDGEKGNVYVRNGSFEITSGGDGLSASGSMTLEGGAFTITAGGGSTGNIQVQDSRTGFKDRGYRQQVQEADAPSTKGIKAAGVLSVSGGDYEIDASDDGIHSDGDIAIAGGTFDISTGDDGVHANDSLVISGGTVDIAQSYEGFEARDIRIEGGSIALVSSDDGLNAGGGNDASGFGGRGGDMFASDGSSITITGGTITVNAEGDGVDSNGNITVSGGVTIVHGPVSGGNGPLDYGGKAVITGGTFAALGSGRMAMNFSSAENQGSMLVSAGNQAAGAQVVLKDSTGAEIFSVTGEKSFSSAVISCPGIVQGGTYTLAMGGETLEITMDSLIYGAGSGMMGGRGGMGGKGNMPGGFGGMGVPGR